MRKVLFFSLALAVLLLAVTLLGCGGGKSPTASSLKGNTYGSIDDALAELEALTPPEGVDPVLFQELKDAFRPMLEARGGKITSVPSTYAVTDLTAPDPQPDPPIITWSSDFFIADGDVSGAVSIADITPIAVYFGMQWTDDAGENYDPEAKKADYNRDGTVAISDLTPLAVTFGHDTADFVVEWSETEDFATVATLGDPVPWVGDEPLNENGFRVFTFTLDSAILSEFPVGAESVWLRVIPRDAEGTAGVPPEAGLEFNLGGVQPATITVTDILVEIGSSVNTDAAGDWEGTAFYQSPAAGGDTTGEIPANTETAINLYDIAYTYQGVPYDFGADPPPEITGEQWAEIWDALHASMTYSVVSNEDPVDPEAWDESDPQPETGYAGFVGPNDPGELYITATMTDNDYTPGAVAYEVNVVMAITEDVNAPEIQDYDPPEQPQNKTGIVTIRMDWGEDEVGDEVPADTDNGVALFAADGTFLRRFDPADPLETPDPPSTAGEYTLERMPAGMEFTTVIRVMVPAGLNQGDYIWRVAEMNDTFECRSSLKKPDKVYTIVGPEYFDMYTWPLGGANGSFSVNSAAQPYVYFFPEDPKIRRNPVGHPTPPPDDPPEFEPDDPIAFEDFIKGDEDTGQEFLIVYGSLTPIPPEPDSPMVYYRYGTEPAQTIGEADGQLPISYLQPHMIGAVVFGTLTEEGDITFSLFDKSGTLLGFVSHYATTMPQPRSAPIVDEECDFGVRPWGTGLDPLDFSDKSADLSVPDVVVFTAKNIWLRHDDNSSMDQSWRSTHVVWTLEGAGQIPDLKMRPHIVGLDTDDLVYLAVDIANPDWWSDITRDIDVGEYSITLLTPGAGSSLPYPDSLFVVP